MDMFRYAAKNKFRFSTSSGALTVEHLFQLDLKQLDQLAVSLYKEIESKGSVQSFITDKKTEDIDLEIKFKIVKDIIDEKLDDRKRAVEEHERREKRQLLANLIQSKEMQAMQDKTIEELQKEYDNLK